MCHSHDCSARHALVPFALVHKQATMLPRESVYLGTNLATLHALQPATMTKMWRVATSTLSS